MPEFESFSGKRCVMQSLHKDRMMVKYAEHPNALVLDMENLSLGGLDHGLSFTLKGNGGTRTCMIDDDIMQ